MNNLILKCSGRAIEIIAESTYFLSRLHVSIFRCTFLDVVI